MKAGILMYLILRKKVTSSAELLLAAFPKNYRKEEQPSFADQILSHSRNTDCENENWHGETPEQVFVERHK